MAEVITIDANFVRWYAAQKGIYDEKAFSELSTKSVSIEGQAAIAHAHELYLNGGDMFVESISLPSCSVCNCTLSRTGIRLGLTVCLKCKEKK